MKSERLRAWRWWPEGLEGRDGSVDNLEDADFDKLELVSAKSMSEFGSKDDAAKAMPAPGRSSQDEVC